MNISPKTTKVLFLCTANSARSQMAEAIARHRYGDRIEAYSAGLVPSGIHPLVGRVIEEIGISISGQHSKSVNQYLGTHHFGYIITLCSDAEQNCPVSFPDVSVRLHWPIDDPAVPGDAEGQLELFRKARNEIDRRISSWVESLSPPFTGNEFK